MLTAILLPLAFAVGHVLLAVAALNSSHALGLNSKRLDHVRDGIVVLYGLAGLAMAWSVRGLAPSDWPLMVRIYGGLCLFILLVAFPAVTIVRLLRRPPAGVERVGETALDLRSEAEHDGEGWRARVLRWPINDSLRPRIAEWSVALEGLPPGLDGLSILHLTDLHFARCYPRGYFERVVETLLDSGEEPDLVLVTGDILDDDATIPWIEPVLGRLRGRLGQFAILGNHDFRCDFRGVLRALRGAGYRTIDGRWAAIDAPGGRVALGGTCYPWGRDVFGRECPGADFRILMSHTPDEFYRAARRGIDLVLAGHNHAGQGRLPIVGPVLMPSRYGRRFDRGFFARGRTRMFVSSGLGAKDPLRINCPPEVTRLTLRCAGARTHHSRPEPVRSRHDAGSPA